MELTSISPTLFEHRISFQKRVKCIFKKYLSNKSPMQERACRVKHWRINVLQSSCSWAYPSFKAMLLNQISAWRHDNYKGEFWFELPCCSNQNSPEGHTQRPNAREHHWASLNDQQTVRGHNYSIVRCNCGKALNPQFKTLKQRIKKNMGNWLQETKYIASVQIIHCSIFHSKVLTCTTWSLSRKLFSCAKTITGGKSHCFTSCPGWK